MKPMEMPNLDSLIAGLNTPTDKAPEKKPTPPIGPTVCAKSSLWELLLQSLGKRQRKSDGGQKVYGIDADIVETINQCDFKAPTTQVINQILRLFLNSHIQHLLEIRKERTSTLFDTYSQNPIDNHEND